MEWLLLPYSATHGVKWNGQPWWKCPEGYLKKKGNVACHTGTSNPRTPIMCQTWHCGAQLCSQPPEEKFGAGEETHNRRQESQTRSSTPQLTTPQHKGRPH